MKSFTTTLGEVTVTDARINRLKGYNKYSINIDFSFEGKHETLAIITNNSVLFDAANGEDDHSEIVLEGAWSSIEQAIDDKINLL